MPDTASTVPLHLTGQDLDTIKQLLTLAKHWDCGGSEPSARITLRVKVKKAYEALNDLY